jgi:hypothetical protein
MDDINDVEIVYMIVSTTWVVHLFYIYNLSIVAYSNQSQRCTLSSILLLPLSSLNIFKDNLQFIRGGKCPIQV